MSTPTSIIPRNPALPATVEGHLAAWLDNHQDAQTFLHHLFFIAATWDDLIDEDKPVLHADIDTAFQAALNLTCNPFYVQHFSHLHPLLTNSIRNWKAANALERDPAATEHALMIAFVLRSSYVDMVGTCASLIKGEAWGIQVAQEARLLCSQEGFQGYLANLKHEEECRHGRVRRNG